MSVTIYGASDDLIEVEGDISEEFYSPLSDNEDNLLVFSDGTVLGIAYSDAGVWRIWPVITVGHVSIEPAPEDDEDNYSDRAIITGPIKWVFLGKTIAKTS